VKRIQEILLIALILEGMWFGFVQRVRLSPPGSEFQPPGDSASPTQPACLERDGQVVVRSLDSRQDYRNMDYRVYLPPCYREQGDRRYPVLYLVHGQSSTDSQWDDLGINETADDLIRKGKIPPLIIVMPRDLVWTPPSQDPFDDILLEELIPLIDREYRTLTDRRHRAVGGLSRGAGWAVNLGLAHWQMFGALGAHTPAVFWEDAPQLRTWLSELTETQRPRIYVDVADRDRDEIRFSAQQLTKILAELAIPHDFYQFVGLHNAEYWSKNLERYLLWYTAEWEN
jgi:enterochelin esterase-like enzyme